MKLTLLHEGEGLRTYLAVLDKGDEVVNELTQLAAEKDIGAASLTGIGAFSRGSVGYFDRATKSYLPIPIDYQVEVLSLTGNLAISDEGPKLHAHVVLSRRDGGALGGHLLEGIAWPTLEIVITQFPTVLHRRVDPETELPLIDL